MNCYCRSELFSADGVAITHGNEKRSQEGIRTWYADDFSQNPPALHLIVNTILQRAGPDTGSAASAELFFRRNESGAWTAIMMFRYLDQFVRQDGQWLIVGHEMEPISWGRVVARAGAAVDSASAAAAADQLR